jgi:ribonuclease PH
MPDLTVALSVRGGGKGTRTPGLNAASVALSQLSYTPSGGHGL